eukprot:Sspe_Gene.104569::Locus_81070_Transcript_1_1_Confidence_1.000_Length_882::g.104569::m.104569
MPMGKALFAPSVTTDASWSGWATKLEGGARSEHGRVLAPLWPLWNGCPSQGVSLRPVVVLSVSPHLEWDWDSLGLLPVTPLLPRSVSGSTASLHVSLRRLLLLLLLLV